MNYNLRKIFNYTTILWLLLIFFLIIVAYNFKVNTIYEGLENESDDQISRLEINRFKIENTEHVIPGSALNDLQKSTQTSQNEVDNYMSTKDYVPVNNDEDVKKAIEILYNDINQFKSTYSKLYFIATTVPIFFEPFVYEPTKLACQYNALLICYPKTIRDGKDYSSMYKLIILSEIANDLINSELDPNTKVITGVKAAKGTSETLPPSKTSNYFGYITDPIIKDIQEILSYFHNKFE
jgi:hypothetical protein